MEILISILVIVAAVAATVFVVKRRSVTRIKPMSQRDDVSGRQGEPNPEDK